MNQHGVVVRCVPEQSFGSRLGLCPLRLALRVDLIAFLAIWTALVIPFNAA
jgi:hypothetical protein